MNDRENIYSVYLVEDSPIIRDRLQQLIEAEAGLSVVGVTGGAQTAIQALTLKPTDAVIIDISLEQGDGFEVLAFVNAMRPKPLVIMLTNYTYMSYRVRGLSGGAQYFFDKTTQFDDVIDVLKRHAQTASTTVGVEVSERLMRQGEDNGR